MYVVEIPIAVLETVVQYMEDRVMRLQIVEDRLSSKLMKHKRNVHTVTRIACANETISDLVDLCAYIDGITKDCRKQEQQNIIGKFLQDVLRGKPQAATTGARGEVQDVKQNEESDEFGGRSSPLFDAERNTLCADVSTADVIKMSEDKSREFWMIKEIPKLYNEPKLSSLDMLQTNPLGRPLLKEGFQEPLHDNIDSIAKTKLSPGSPTQYIAPSLEQILVESPEKRLGTPKSRPGSPNMLNKALNPPLNDANGSNDTEKEENFVSPLELLAKSPYLGKYSIDNIQKKKKMQQKIASVQATKTASLKGKSQCKSSKLPKLKAKDLEAERVVRKSKYSEDILLVPLFAEKLFTIDDKPVDCDAPSTHSKCKNIVAKELSHLSYAERLKVMMVEVDMANEKILQRNPTLKHSDIGTENNSEIAGEGVSRSNDNDAVGLMDNGKEKEVKEMSDAEKQSVFREQEALALAAQRSEMKRLEDELLQMRKQQYEAVVTDTSTKFVERLTGGVLYAASIVEKIEKELQQRTQQEQCV